MSLRQYIRRWTDRFILERKRITVMDQLASERELLDRIAALKAENEELRASAGGLARCMGLANMTEVSKAIQEHAPWNGKGGVCDRHIEDLQLLEEALAEIDHDDWSHVRSAVELAAKLKLRLRKR